MTIALKPDSILLEYRIVRVLGHGGFGISYLALDTHLDKTVAIKEYLPTDLAVRSNDMTVSARTPDAEESFTYGLENFLKEARMLARFTHPNLIQVHRFFKEHGTAYFVMEYAEGVTLAEELRQSETLQENRLRNVLLPVMSGLEQVHREGVLHRDIKPHNIILRKDGTPVLIDFGAARQNLGALTRSIMSIVTAGYAPLEQYGSSVSQGPWTDMYALGAVAYRAISGRKPPDAVNRVREDPMVPAARVGHGRYSPQFLAAVDWALAVNAEDRPASVAEWRQALEGQRTPPGMEAPPPETAPVGDDDPTRVVPKAEGSAEPTLVLPRARIPPSGPDSSATFTARRASLALWGIVGASLLAVAVLAWQSYRQASPPPPAAPVKEAETVTVTTEPATTAPPPAQPEARLEPAKTETPAKSGPVPAKPKPITAKPKAEAKPARQTVAQMAALSVFRDCANCPEMVVLSAGTFQMGSPKGAGPAWEKPQHKVTLARPFAMARYEVTNAEWNACVKAGRCRAITTGPSSGDAGKAPAVNLSLEEAQGYTRWLTQTTGRSYRLPSESEWEYAMRAGTSTSRYWGDDRRGQCEYANAADRSARRRDSTLEGIDCDDRYAALSPVGSFKPNAFGLFDMAGNAWEWTLDCWQNSYKAAKGDGRPAQAPDCARRVIRGGSWRTKPESLRSANRGVSTPDHHSEDLGLRVVAE